jgi:hypothetical protein
VNTRTYKINDNWKHELQGNLAERVDDEQTYEMLDDVGFFTDDENKKLYDDGFIELWEEYYYTETYVLIDKKNNEIMVFDTK